VKLCNKIKHNPSLIASQGKLVWLICFATSSMYSNTEIVKWLAHVFACFVLWVTLDIRETQFPNTAKYVGVIIQHLVIKGGNSIPLTSAATTQWHSLTAVSYLENAALHNTHTTALAYT
jgi:hypothetical protein